MDKEDIQIYNGTLLCYKKEWNKQPLAEAWKDPVSIIQSKFFFQKE